MYLTTVRLADMRNYAGLEYSPACGLNLIFGANAQGKSNLLEAIALLGTGKSFRTAREVELVRDGTERALIAGDARIQAGSIRLTCEIERLTRSRAQKRYAVNGEPVRFARFLGSVNVVTFVPADLALVSGPPAGRRAFLNGSLAQIDPRYYRELARYQKMLAQKAALLRGQGELDFDLLDTYDEALATAGAVVVAGRVHLVRSLAQRASEAYARWGAAGEHLALSYAPSVGAADTDDHAVLRERLAEAFRRVRAGEIARRMSLAGPHRDDLVFTLDERPIDAFGSQGQQRSAVLAVKVAEYDTLRDATGEAPILLLDDVLSELDAGRAGRFLDALAGVEQTFLTATEPPAGLPRIAGRFEVVAGTVRPC